MYYKITILQILLGLSIKSEIFVKTTKTIVFLFILLYKTFMYLMQFDLLVAKVGDKTMSTNNLWENKLDNAKRTVTKQLSTLGFYLIHFFCKHNFVVFTSKTEKYEIVSHYSPISNFEKILGYHWNRVYTVKHLFCALNLLPTLTFPTNNWENV